MISSIFVSVILLVTACNSGYSEDNLVWGENLEEAVQVAQNENKAVLVNFTGSDWCKWCFKLSDEVFSQDEFASYAAENLVLVKIDFPRNISQSNETKIYNQNLAQRFRIQGFPTILVINNQGQLVAKTGYQPGGAANYVNHIQSFL